ncbi:DDB1- and CUL4-associated factor 6-like [Anneissia japonica]|uniref:DDB1- and CUL4-associated factor 6-like n=1 Tax=Anneissia japonica TaxID=1529436 RepID=UPI0014257B68|nr:DDB1- and CUL4-associated factor 6-like [Anneissia japonica]
MERKRNITWKARARSIGSLDFQILRRSIIGDANFVQRLKLDTKLAVHSGCVNSICWSDNGETILSGSDDKNLVVTNGHTRAKMASITSGHKANIFCAKYIPVSRDKLVVSCSGDGMLAFNELEREDTHGMNMFNCHYGTVYELATIPQDPHSFISSGEDGTVRFFDLRMKTKCLKDECREDVLINCRCAVTSLSVNPVTPYHLAVGCSDSSICIFDRRMLGTKGSGNFTGRGIHGMFSRFSPPHLQTKYCRPTSLSYSHDGREMLVSYSSEYIYLFGTDTKDMLLDGEDERKGNPLLDKDEMPPVNPVKRLRVRGDWSDTGPTARPRAESGESQSPQTVMQRMSELFTRWLEDAAGSQPSVLLDLPRTSLDTSFRTEEPSRQSRTERVRSTQRESRHSTDSQQSTSLRMGSCSLGAEATLMTDSASDTSSQPEASAEHSKMNQAMCPELSASGGQMESEIHLSARSSSEDHCEWQEMMSEDADTSSLTSLSTVKSAGESCMTKTDLSGFEDKKRRCSQHSSTSDGTAEEPESSRRSRRSKKVLKIDDDGGDDGESDDSSSDDFKGKMNESNGKKGWSNESEKHVSKMKDSAKKGLKDQSADENSSDRSQEPGTSRRWVMDNEGDDVGSSREDKSTKRMKSRGERVRQALLGKAREEREKEKEQIRSITSLKVKNVYRGHRNSRTMIKEAGFWGDNLVLSGSDCGHVFIWDRHTTELLMLLEGDRHVVNCVQPHPYEPILATSGIDYDIKLWAPLADEPCRPTNAEEVMRVNELMLEETRDTITVPPSFILRMMSTLRNLRSSRNQRATESSSSDDDS